MEVAVEVRLDHQAQVPPVRAHLVAVQVQAQAHPEAAQETPVQQGEKFLVSHMFPVIMSNSSSSISTPSYGGGRYYGGGATTAYKSGGRSPLGLAPYAIGIGALGIFPGIWLAGAYAYNFNHPYYFHNATNTTNPRNNESLPVTCLCQQYQACGCDDNGNTTYIDDLLGNGSTAAQNSTLVHVGNVNGTKTVVLNGTLPNGTDDSDSSTSGALRQSVVEMSGFWVVGAVVLATVFT